MKLTFATKSALDADTPLVSGERLVNLYAVPGPAGGRAQFFLRNVAGTRPFASVPGPFLRAMASPDGVLHVVSAGTLSRVSDTGSVATLAAVTDDLNTTIVGARSSVGVCSGGAYLLWSGSAITQPAGGRLTSIGSIAFSNQYVLMSEKDGREIEWTTAGAPGTRNALHFATAEGRDDKIVRLMAVGVYVWVLKQRSTEIWGVAGSGSGAWARLPGAVRERGLKAHNLVCAVPDALFFVGNDNVAYMAQSGGALQAVSTPPVDTALALSDPTHCAYYEERGHRFCVVRFSDRPAWIYDASMGLWHERAAGPNHDAWGVVAAAEVGGQWHVGSRLGRVQRLGRAPVDEEGPMYRTAVSQTLRPGVRFKVNRLEIEGQFAHDIEEQAPSFLLDQNGFPITDQDGEPYRAAGPSTAENWTRGARLSLSVSGNGGLTFGLPKLREIARRGDFGRLCTFRAMGQFRAMAVRVDMTDAVEMQMLSAMDLQ